MTFAVRRVLLVEDEFLAGLTTIGVLEGFGCEVVGPVARLALALQLAKSEILDAGVLDINIAGELIWPVAEELHRRGVPFLFLSGYSQQTIVPAQFAAASFVAKPLDQRRFLHHFCALWSPGGCRC